MGKVDWDNVGCVIFLGIIGAFLYVLAIPYLPLAVQGGIDTLLLIAFGFMCRCKLASMPFLFCSG